MTKEDLKSSVNYILGKFGYKRKGWNWYAPDGDNLIAINLQKSNYGLQYYINLCCWPEGMTIDGSPTPEERKFPIRVRAEGLFPSLSDDIKRYFDLENDLYADEERRNLIVELLSEHVCPFLKKIEDVPGLKSMIAAGRFKDALINRAAQERLAL